MIITTWKETWYFIAFLLIENILYMTSILKGVEIMFSITFKKFQ